MLKQLIQRLLDSRTTPQQAKDCNDLDFSKEITVLNTTAISSANFTYIALMPVTFVDGFNVVVKVVQQWVQISSLMANVCPA